MWIWVQLAGGAGSRFGEKRPKQFKRLRGRPLLSYAIETFLQVAPESPVVVVLPLDHFAYGKALLNRFLGGASLHYVVGGPTRSASTEAALHYLNQLGWLTADHLIAFHDAARPFVSEALLRRVFAAAETYGAALPALPVSFSLRRVSEEGSEALPREGIWEVQTPQAFQGHLLQLAWKRLSPTAETRFTDEGSWIEAAGFRVQVVAGEPTNLKITHPIDWEVARAWLRRLR